MQDAITYLQKWGSGCLFESFNYAIFISNLICPSSVMLYFKIFSKKFLDQISFVIIFVRYFMHYAAILIVFMNVFPEKRR